VGSKVIPKWHKRPQVLPERISYRWLLRRFYYSGVERALTKNSMRPSATGRVFMDYVAYVFSLPALWLGYRRGRRMLAKTSEKNVSTEGMHH
jgi:hypothetical protein